VRSADGRNTRKTFESGGEGENGIGRAKVDCEGRGQAISNKNFYSGKGKHVHREMISESRGGAIQEAVKNRKCDEIQMGPKKDA